MTENAMPQSLGRYRIVRELGKGAMGVVYEGLDPNIGRRVAIKTARRDVMQSSGRGEELMERFLREARAAGALNHPNIVTIYDADEAEGDLAYIAMEFLDGPDLMKLLHDKRRFLPKDAVEIAATVCSALAHAHEHGVIHRDVKPSNIIMLNNGTIKVADFGIARVADSNLTQEGSMIGTPHYMSPEQFMAQPVDARSDLFSVGIILYELLTGERPFTGEALSTVMHSVIRVTPIEPRELNFAVCDCLSKVVMKALSKDPQQRYQTGVAMAAALCECLKEQPDPAITLIPAAPTASQDAPTILANHATAPTVIAAAPAADALSATHVRPTEPVAPDTEGPAKDDLEKPPVRGPARKRTRTYPALAASVLVLVLVGSLFAMMKQGTGDGKTPKQAGIADAGQFYYEDVTVKVYLVSNKALEAGIDISNLNEAELDKGVKAGTVFLNHANVEVSSKGSDALKPIRESATAGIAKIPLGPGWEKVGVHAEEEGYDGNEGALSAASKPGQHGETFVYLLQRN